MLADDPIRGSGAFDRLFLNVVPGFPAFFYRGGEPFAGFDDLLSGHIRGGGKQGLGVLGKALEIVINMGGIFCIAFLVSTASLLATPGSSADRT